MDASYKDRVKEARANLKCCGVHVPEDYNYCPYCGCETFVYVEKTPEEKYEDRRFIIMTIRNLYRNGHLERYRRERHRKYGPSARRMRQLVKSMEAELLCHAKPTTVLGKFSSKGKDKVTFRRGK